MIIPKLHNISQGSSPKEHLDEIQKACTSGVELVQFNIKQIKLFINIWVCHDFNQYKIALLTMKFRDLL